MITPLSETRSPTSASDRTFWLCVVAALLAGGLWLHGPIAQWAAYHAFADARSWLGIPNAQNVLSNLPFAGIGIWGWHLHARSMSHGRLVWRGFAAALVCTAIGSMLYHWCPGNGALVFDRLPIAWACALLTCALIGERVDARWWRGTIVSCALLFATASVASWWLGERHGAGDLRPYLFVQFLPMLIALAALLSKLPSTSASALRDRDWWAVLGLYVAAKVMELADHTVMDALGFTSGHTLKHLLAALAALWLLRAAARAQLR